jgi:Fe2+ transport system protein FeoA
VKLKNSLSFNSVPLLDMPIEKEGTIVKIDESILNRDQLRDCLDQGFLPGTKIQVLANYHSQKKVLTIISQQMKVALSYSIAKSITVQYES